MDLLADIVGGEDAAIALDMKVRALHFIEGVESTPFPLNRFSTENF